jgi:hypothetical protein
MPLSAAPAGSALTVLNSQCDWSLFWPAEVPVEWTASGLASWRVQVVSMRRQRHGEKPQTSCIVTTVADGWAGARSPDIAVVFIPRVLVAPQVVIAPNLNLLPFLSRVRHEPACNSDSLREIVAACRE